MDLTELNQLAELSYESSCDGIILGLTKCVERLPQSYLQIAKTLTVVGHLLVAGSEELVAAVSANFATFRAGIECSLGALPPDNAADTTSFIRERVDAITELLCDHCLLSQSRRGATLVLSHILRRKDPRAGFSLGMTAGSKVHGEGFDTSPSGFLRYRAKFEHLDITHQVALKVVIRYPNLARGKEIRYIRACKSDCRDIDGLKLELVQSEDKPFHNFDTEYLVMAALTRNQIPRRPRRFPDKLWWLALKTWQIAYAARPTAAMLSSQMDTLLKLYTKDPVAWNRTAIPQSMADLPFAAIEHLLGDELGHGKELSYLLKATSLQALYVLVITGRSLSAA
ncbi:hypothetical protein AURDEDRAFT_153339 [Auricularia subglabra TFB-10046 SS5]|nr:hypothetical protein AURDEDRAFT_153339 [Auricularia subglabra TFB-10046 SS5]